MKSGFGPFGFGVLGFGLSGCTAGGLLPDGLSGAGRVAEGLLPDGLEGFLSAGLISGFGFAVGLLSGLAAELDGWADGRVDGLEAGRAFVSEGLEAGLADVPDGREVDVVDLEVDDEREFPRDCASSSGWKAVNANPISIAANVVADNLIVLEFCGTDEGFSNQKVIDQSRG